MAAQVVVFPGCNGPRYRSEGPISALCHTDLMLLKTLRFWFLSQTKAVPSCMDWRTPLYGLGGNDQTCAVGASLLSLVTLYSVRTLQVRPPQCELISADEATFLQLLWEQQEGGKGAATHRFLNLLKPIINQMAQQSACNFVTRLNLHGIRLMQQPNTASIYHLKPKVDRNSQSSML